MLCFTDFLSETKICLYVNFQINVRTIIQFKVTIGSTTSVTYIPYNLMFHVFSQCDTNNQWLTLAPFCGCVLLFNQGVDNLPIKNYIGRHSFLLRCMQHNSPFLFSNSSILSLCAFPIQVIYFLSEEVQDNQVYLKLNGHLKK